MASSLLLLLFPPLPFSSLKSRRRRLGQARRRHLLLPKIQASKNSNNNNSSADPPDRLISAACYLYPFLDGVRYGRYVLTQFPLIQLPLQPLIPIIKLFNSFPLNSFLLFLTLYFAVVRNPSIFSRYVRFNTMQAIVLDVLLIFPDLIERSFNPGDGIGLDVVMSLDSTVFLFLLVSLLYGSTSCLLGKVPRLPIVADAADRQVMSFRLTDTGFVGRQYIDYACKLRKHIMVSNPTLVSLFQHFFCSVSVVAILAAPCSFVALPATL